MNQPSSRAKDRIATILQGMKKAESIGRLHHAYLLTGSESAGKLSFAQRWMETFSIQQGGPTEEVSILDRIARGVSPDFHEIKPVEDSIPVEAIRELPKVCAYAPLEFSKRLIVIHDANLLNIQSSNALLKILEEPPRHSIFLLFCQERSQLLQTIGSRCQEIRFFPLSSQELTEIIAKDLGRVPPQAIVDWCEGSTQRWGMFHSIERAQETFFEAREQLFQLWEHSPRIPFQSLRWLEEQEDDSTAGIIVDTWQKEVRNFSGFLLGDFPPNCEDSTAARYSKIQACMNEKSLLEIAEKGAAFSRFRIHRGRNSNLKLNLLNLFCSLQFSQK